MMGIPVDSQLPGITALLVWHGIGCCIIAAKLALHATSAEVSQHQPGINAARKVELLKPALQVITHSSSLWYLCVRKVAYKIELF